MILSDEALDHLQFLSDRCDPPTWRAMVEGRDHVAGDSFIMVGENSERDEDIYVTTDSGPASDSLLDLIAAARMYLPLLIDEVRSNRTSAGDP